MIHYAIVSIFFSFDLQALMSAWLIYESPCKLFLPFLNATVRVSNLVAPHGYQ